MNDAFYELIVAKQPTSADKAKKVLLIAVTALAGLGALFVFPPLLVLFLILIFVDSRLFPKFNVEYEYTYVNGEIDIAEVYSRQSRKEVAQITLENVECAAPLGSHHLDEFGNTYKVVDYSAGDPQNRPYVIVTGGENKQKILLQLNEKMAEDLRYRIPRKMFTD
ncbi:MAG: DUF6106 family protein [Lachnospiraceae bacterium]|nr:DUF6106 family protein [Lachnospiraceae bacterium]